MASEEKSKTAEAVEVTPVINSSKNPWLVLLVVVIILGAAGFLFRDKLMAPKSSSTTTTAEQKSSGYQAVFLTNGQVYFGKLSMSGDYVKLTDIYYLQVTNPPQLQGAGSQTASQQQPKIELVKLGNELHGPVDAMQINKTQVLFYEDMKEEGKVMQAIRTNQKTPAAAPTTTAPATTTPAIQQ